MKLELAQRYSRRLQHTRAYFSSPDAAPPRNFTNEMVQTLRGYQQTAPGYLSLEQQFEPQYGQLALDNQSQNMFGFDDAQGHHPGQLELNRYGTSYQRAGDIGDASRQRGADISDLERLGPRANEAFLNANPLLRGSLNNLFDRTTNTGLLNTLNDQASSALAAGGNLTPEEQRAIDQQTREIYSDRGTLMGNHAIGAELLNRDAARRQRLQAAQNLAGTVQGMNQNQNDFVGRASQIFGTTLADPVATVLGRPSGSGSSGGGGNGQYPQQVGTGSRIFDPTNPYAQDLYNSNFNAQNANNIATANANNATTSAVVSGVGSLLGGLLASDERLKKNVIETGAKTKDGIPIIEGEFKTDPNKKRYRMVRAQDAEKVRPDAVHTDPVSGVKMVDYWGLGMPMMEVAA